VNSTIAMAASSIPAGTRIFGPSRGSNRFVLSCAAMTSITIIGRKATPVCIGV
jgi:hypothetical protein